MLETETYTYEAAYTYPINDGMTITPGVFIKEVASAGMMKQDLLLKHHLTSNLI